MRCKSWIPSLVLVIALVEAEMAPPLNAASASSPHAHLAAGVPCTGAVCSFQLGINPGLLAGKPFACPAIQHAVASVTVRNRFATHADNDTLRLHASGLPPNTGFDVFLVEHSPLDTGVFSDFGVGWYQSDMESNAAGVAEIRVVGIFDKETFVLERANPLSLVHTYNVGFWFNSPSEEQQVCGNTSTPAQTPFNGEQNAGLLAMISHGAPLQMIQ
jgi:hypothetical protein